VDGDANENLYRRKVVPQQILKGQDVIMPDGAKPLLDAIERATAKEAEQKKQR
jgi:lipid-binding SYLF domain-containing protein